MLQENRAAFANGQGLVYEPNPWQTQGSGAGLVDGNDATSAELDAQRIDVVLEGLDEGTGLLIGEFVDVATLNSETLTDVDADEPTRVYNYDRDDDRFEQVVVYHSVDQINRYFQELGFDDDSGIPNGIRDFPTLANAHWFDQDQSFYSTADDAIHMGDGGVDDGEDADIIAHEFGHAVQHNQNAAWGGGEMGAMGEGFGDFLAANFYRNHGDEAFQQLHAPAVGEWDALSYSSADPPNLRRVDGNKMYPGDLVGAVHADGEIWSRALWDLSNIVGRDYSTQLVLESHFTLNANATMTDGANAILLAHENIGNENHTRSAVRHAFAVRGILPPTQTVDFNFDVYQENGVQITIYASDVNAGPTEMATITSSDGDVEQVLMMNLGTGYMIGTANFQAGAATPNNGFIGLISEVTNITVNYGTASDAAIIEAELVVIEGTNGDDVIIVDIGATRVDVSVNGVVTSIDTATRGALEFDAKAGNDTITINDSSGDDVVITSRQYVEVNGDFRFTASNVEVVTVNSGGGNDVARMYGTDRNDLVEIGPNSAVYSGEQFVNTINNYPRVLTYATPGGSDEVTFTDSAGTDRFYGTQIYANMSYPGAFANARGFDKVTAISTAGGFDYASFIGSDSADMMYASAMMAQLKGAGYELNAQQFERVSVNARAGQDTATLEGSDGSDVFYSTPRFGYMYGSGYFNHAIGFETVTADGGSGEDRANMFDSAGADTFRAESTVATLSNAQYSNEARGFERVSAFGTAGDNIAILMDSPGNDRFVGRSKDAYMIGAGFLNYVAGFDSVTATASAGNDIAIFRDSIEDDRFFASRAYSSMTGNTFFNRAENFDRVSAFMSKGVDRARFEDSSGNDTFVGKGQEASMYAPGYFVHTVGLDVITAVSDKGGRDILGGPSIDFDLIKQGNWNA